MARYWRTRRMGMTDSCGMAFTRSGIFIDSHVREAVQLKDGVKYKDKGITYTLKGIGQDELSISLTVRLYSRIGEMILTGK